MGSFHLPDLDLNPDLTLQYVKLTLSYFLFNYLEKLYLKLPLFLRYFFIEIQLYLQSEPDPIPFCVNVGSGLR